MSQVRQDGGYIRASILNALRNQPSSSSLASPRLSRARNLLEKVSPTGSRLSTLTPRPSRVRNSTFAKCPLHVVAKFLDSKGVVALSELSRDCHRRLKTAGGHILPNVQIAGRNLDFSTTNHFVDRFSLPVIVSLELDLKSCDSGLLRAFALRAHNLTDLRHLAVHAGGLETDIVEPLKVLFSRLSRNQLRSVSFRGLRELSLIGECLSTQSLSIERVKSDYFVKSHENLVTSQMLPRMPMLRELFVDVAEVADIHASLLLDRLACIESPPLFERLYLPHLRIVGDVSDVSKLVHFIFQNFENLQELVLRFERLAFTVQDLSELRLQMNSLPAACISTAFMVIRREWAHWWPSISSVWNTPDAITGFAIFKEQIDSGAFGVDTLREWRGLTAEQREKWESMVPSVLGLYESHISELSKKIDVKRKSHARDSLQSHDAPRVELGDLASLLDDELDATDGFSTEAISTPESVPTPQRVSTPQRTPAGLRSSAPIATARTSRSPLQASRIVGTSSRGVSRVSPSGSGASTRAAPPVSPRVSAAPAASDRSRPPSRASSMSSSPVTSRARGDSTTLRR